MCLPHHDQLSCVSPWQQYSEAPLTSQVILFSVYNPMCLPHHDQLSCVSPWQQYSEAPPTSQPYVFASPWSAQLCITMAAVFWSSYFSHYSIFNIQLYVFASPWSAHLCISMAAVFWSSSYFSSYSIFNIQLYVFVSPWSAQLCISMVAVFWSSSYLSHILFSVYNSMCLPHHDQLSCVSPWQQYSEAPPTSLYGIYIHSNCGSCLL